MRHRLHLRSPEHLRLRPRRVLGLPIGRGAVAASRGRLVARALDRSWRATVPAPLLSADELAAVAPALLRTGGGPLACRRNRALVEGTAGLAELHDAWRLQVLQSAVLEERIPVAVSRLRAAGVEPLLAKGWAVARLYPQPGLRPYGDIDLYVPPAELAIARAAADSLTGVAVDLHRGVPELDGRAHEAVLARAERVVFAGVEVRVLAPEDHLRLLCLHFLRHGGARPLWLCDIALMLEARRPGFDWDLVLAGLPVRREALLATLVLAATLLGADVAGTPAAGVSLPRWLEPAVLRQWGEGVVRREPLRTYVTRPAAFWEELRRHWPNGVEASAALEAPFDDRPRLPLQLAHFVLRGARFGVGLVRSRRA